LLARSAVGVGAAGARRNLIGGHAPSNAAVNRALSFLHVTTFYPPYSFGGDATYVYRLSGALADAGHHVDVLHSIDAYRLTHPGDPDVWSKGHQGVTVHGLQSRAKWLTTLTAHQTGRPLFQTKEISRILNQRTYDVIHFHNISLFGPGILTLSPAGPPPVKVYTTHEHWLVCPMHVLWKFNKRPCEAPDCLACTLQAGRPPQLWRFTDYLRRATAHVDLFLAPSRFVAAKHVERGFDRPFSVLPLFVEDGEDENRSAPSPHARPYVLYVGRLERLKGVDTLIAAINACDDVDLLIAGTGAEEQRLKTAAASNPRIHFLGFVPADQLGPLYAHAVASCVPSLTYEVFPTVALESLARRTPIVARDLGGLTEIVRDSGGGMLFNTHRDLVTALQTLARNPALRHEMGERGYSILKARWSKSVHLQAYLALLESARRNRETSGARSTNTPR
jgi:glycosyltransferase involved in cell wall biosynthesis